VDWTFTGPKKGCLAALCRHQGLEVPGKGKQEHQIFRGVLCGTTQIPHPIFHRQIFTAMCNIPTSKLHTIHNIDATFLVPVLKIKT